MTKVGMRWVKDLSGAAALAATTSRVKRNARVALEPTRSQPAALRG